jgi:hypothetical protein
MNALQNWRTEAKALLGPSPITFESRQQCRRLMVLFRKIGGRHHT